MSLRRQRAKGLGRVGVPTKVDPLTKCKVCGEAFDWCTCEGECEECGYPRDDCECDEDR
jgi:hypothetical protein